MSELGKEVDSLCAALDEVDEWVAPLVVKLIADGFKPLFRGRHRIAFETPAGDVLKLPRRVKGSLYRDSTVEANLQEVETYQRINFDPKHRFFGRLAPCTLLILDEIPCVLMERVFPLRYGTEPEWAGDRFAVGHLDGRQVGYLPRTGEILAYDYAGELGAPLP